VAHWVELSNAQTLSSPRNQNACEKRTPDDPDPDAVQIECAPSRREVSKRRVQANDDTINNALQAGGEACSEELPVALLGEATDPDITDVERDAKLKLP
jgi:hypothetical protein